MVVTLLYSMEFCLFVSLEARSVKHGRKYPEVFRKLKHIKFSETTSAFGSVKCNGIRQKPSWIHLCLKWNIQNFLIKHGFIILDLFYIPVLFPPTVRYFTPLCRHGTGTEASHVMNSPCQKHIVKFYLKHIKYFEQSEQYQEALTLITYMLVWQVLHSRSHCCISLHRFNTCFVMETYTQPE